MAEESAAFFKDFDGAAQKHPFWFKTIQILISPTFPQAPIV
jgi:hypothetical protein